MSQSLTLVFCGTPRFAVPTLEALVRVGFPVGLVVTQPDKPRGRGLVLAPSAVKESALALQLPVTQPESIKHNNEFHSQLTALKPDAIIVVGYGRIIPQWMIDLPRFGNINLHASLLPKYRGAAPIQWAIARGETVTGVTIMRIDAGLDTGDILLQKEVPIKLTDTAETLAPALAATRRRPDGRHFARTASWHNRAAPAGSRKCNARAHPEKTRWPNRLSPNRTRNLQSLARIPALAWCLHNFSRQEPSRLASSRVANTRSHPGNFVWRVIACSSDVEKARPWHCSRYNRKARSVCQQRTSSMAIVPKAAKSWGCNRDLRTEN